MGTLDDWFLNSPSVTVTLRFLWFIRLVYFTIGILTGAVLWAL